MRLIDADALRNALYDADAITMRGVAIINRSTTIDAVPVVRCKDCKHYEIHRPKVSENCERNAHLIPMSPDDFCSCGERRSDD